MCLSSNKQLLSAVQVHAGLSFNIQEIKFLFLCIRVLSPDPTPANADKVIGFFFKKCRSTLERDACRHENPPKNPSHSFVNH